MQQSHSKSTDSSIRRSSTPEAKLLEINRKFEVPVERLYKAFTDAETLKVWWWPNGMYADRIDLDFREGGHFFINMKGYEEAGGGGMTGTIEEIVPNKLLVMTDQFADKNGKAISAKEAGMPGTWPEKIYISFEFESNGTQGSGFRLSQTGIPNELQKDCIQGWSESFDKLEKYLNERNQ